MVNVLCRYARANNPLMGDLYNPDVETSYILYVDANNLYGHAMRQLLPDDEFTWLTEIECREAEHVLADKETRDMYFAGERHFIFNVDLEYPTELHDRDDDYQMAPEIMTIDVKTISNKQHELLNKYFGATNQYSRKLVSSFLPKRNYVVLGELLQFYLDNGMRLVKVNSGIHFTASPIFAPYIDNNTEKRKLNKDDLVMKNYYTLMNNSVFGKSITDEAKFMNFKLLTDLTKARK